MFSRKFIVKRLPLLIFIIALGLFVLSMAGNSHEGNTERIAKSAKHRIEKRLDILDTYITTALDPQTNDYSSLKDLPEDMVIYKYVNDSLKF